MYREYKKEVRDILKNKELMVVSDDLDGYISASIAQKYIGLRAVGFFNPYGLYLEDKIQQDKLVGLDMTLDNKYTNFPTLSNHVEKVGMRDKFSNGVSCNEHISLSNYTNKSLFSTALMMWSALDLPLPKEREGKMLLLLLDSTYQQFYNSSFKKHSVGYLRAYGLDELVDVLEGSTEDEFKEMAQRYRTYRPVRMDDDDLAVDEYNLYNDGLVDEMIKMLGLERVKLPNKYKYKMVLDRHSGNSYSYGIIRESCDVISFSMIYRNTVNYSVLNRVEVR